MFNYNNFNNLIIFLESYTLHFSYGIQVDKLNWDYLSDNPNVIKLLEDRVKYQLLLNEEQLNGLSIHKRISWQKISANPAIFTIFIPQ
jgi:hypothetical protein